MSMAVILASFQIFLCISGVTAVQLGGCNVTLSDNSDIDALKDGLSRGENLVYFDFTINGGKMVDSNYTGEIFQPLTWIRTRGTRGEGLLWLRRSFEPVSLATLSFGVVRLKINLQDSPLGCLKSQYLPTSSAFIRDLILHNLDSTTGSELGNGWNQLERLCNARLRGKHGFTEQFYDCCFVNRAGVVQCSELQRDDYIDILLWCILLINIFAIMFAPWLVPERLYRAKTGFQEYEHKLITKTSIRIRTTSITPSNSENVIQLSALREMPEFHGLLKSLKDDAGYELQIDKLYINAKLDKLITENDAPVGITTTLFNNFILCNIHENRMVKACCASSICGKCIRIPGRTISWYKIIRELTIAVFLFSLVGVPWAIRVWVYYTYEAEHQESLRLAAKQRNLLVLFPGSMTLLLSPKHAVFLVCYVLIALNGILFVSLRKAVTKKFKNTLRKCFRDMNSNNSAKIFGWAFAVLLKPFEKFGCFGFIVAPFYLIICTPIVLCVLLVYCLPTFNITLRLFFSLVTLFIPRKANVGSLKRNFKSWLQDILELNILFENESVDDSEPDEKEKCVHKLLQMIIVFMSILSMYALIIIFLECFAFFVEVFVYVLIGIILNAKILMKNVSLVFILVLYAKDCFGGVNKKYKLFNKTVVSAVEGKVHDDLLQISWQSDEVQKHTAFQVKSEIPVPSLSSEDRNSSSPVKLIVNDGVLEWHIQRLLLFLDNKDVPYIPVKFFFDASHMPCSGCPGSLSENLRRATIRFMIIVLFLVFVSIVVIAFGDLYNVSSVNQTLATLAGGFLPFVFTKFLFKTTDLSIDTSNLNFQACFNKVIHEFSQSWPVADIVEVRESSMDEGDSDDTASIPKTGIVADDDDIRLTTISPLRLKHLEDSDAVKFDLIIDMRSRKTHIV